LAEAYGAQQRVLNLARLLERFGDVSFVIVPTEVEDDQTASKTNHEFQVHRVIRPSLEQSRGIGHRCRHEFDPACMDDPYVVSEPDLVRMQDLIRQHDVVWVHTIRTANWFRIYRWPHSVLDVDDLPSRQYQSAAQAGGSPFRRLLDLRMSLIWRRRERRLSQRFDALVVCSEEDRRYLDRAERPHVVPNGAHTVDLTLRNLSDPPRIGLIGNCTFKPNEEGATWFIRDVWPIIKRELPLAQLRLVGRGSEGHLSQLGPDITGLGWLQDPGDEIASWSAMIVPIKEGSGTRVKVADGFARRCPVVATSIGAFGYDVEHRREILLADHAESFATACLELLKSPEYGSALAERAHQRFLDRWTWDSFEGTVGTIVQECLTRNGHSRI
jgi:glycosyltransferase involved in cell wall biosynthesis